MSRYLDELSVTPLADGVQWRINTDFRFDCGVIITVPARFVTDFASIPRALWPVLPPWQRYGAAAVVHDWLYWDQKGLTREDADEILRVAMRTLAVDEVTIAKIHNAVRIFGQASWDRNTDLKNSGFTRTASAESNPPYASII